MTAKRLAISCAAFTLLCATAKAQEPELAARLDVGSVIDLTRKATPFIDKLDPKSSGLLVLGMVGLTLNPQFANYDLSKPFAVLAYTDPKGGVVGKWSLCGVVWRKGEKSTPYMKALGVELASKDFGSRAALATSDSLFDRIPAEFQKDPASSDPALGAPDLSLWANAGLASKKGFLKGLFMPAENAQGAIIDPAKLESLQAKSVRLESYEALLKQASSLRADLSLSDSGKARVSLRLEATQGSALEAFLKGQGGSIASFPQAISIRGMALCGASALKADAASLSALAGMYGRIAEATGDGSKAKALSDFVSLLLSEASAGQGFCIGEHAGKAFGCVSLTLTEGAGPRLEKSLAGFASRTSTPKLYCLREWKSGVSSYCLVEEGRVWLLSGRYDEDDAAFALSSKKALPPVASEKGLLAYASCDEDSSAPKLLTALLDEGGALALNVEFTPADLERLPLPAPSQPKANGLGR